ncbi:hypothetical protein CHS0354_007337, partial [Potamilus streckersoni]
KEGKPISHVTVVEYCIAMRTVFEQQQLKSSALLRMTKARLAHCLHENLNPSNNLADDKGTPRSLSS